MTDASQIKGHATVLNQSGSHPTGSHPNYFQLQRQLRGLIDRHLSSDHLHDRLQDLPL